MFLSAYNSTFNITDSEIATLLKENILDNQTVDDSGMIITTKPADSDYFTSIPTTPSLFLVGENINGKLNTSESADSIVSDIKVTSNHNIPNINNLLFGVNKVANQEISEWEISPMMPNVPYYIINGSGIRPGLGSCGYSKVSGALLIYRFLLIKLWRHLS